MNCISPTLIGFFLLREVLNKTAPYIMIQLIISLIHQGWILNLLRSDISFPYSSTKNPLTSIPISWLLNILWRKPDTSPKKRNWNNKNIKCFDEEQQKNCQKSICKHTEAFFTLNSPHWPMMYRPWRAYISTWNHKLHKLPYLITNITFQFLQYVTQS